MFPIRPRISLSLPRAIAIACMLLSSVSAQEGGAPLQAHFAAAQQAQQEGRLDVAVQEYQQVLRLQPGLPEAYVNLGLVYYAQAEFDESAHALTMAAKLRPGMRGVSLWLGIDDVKLNRPVQGAALLREAIRQDPSEKLAQSWLGTALWDAGQTDAALFQMGKASADFPDDPDLLFARGEAYGKAAGQQTEQLLGETSGTALSDLIYGTHYAEVRDWEKAEGHLRRAIERDPHSLDVRLELARVLMEQAKLAAAQEQLEQAMAMTPRSAAALARSGEVLVLMQQTAEGLERIGRAFEIDPNETLDALGLPQENVPGSEQAGDALLPLCRDATEKLEANVAFNPAKEVALAALYAQAGDRDAALRAYQMIGTAQRTMSPDASLVAQAREQMHRHRYDDAEPLLLRWLAAHPDDRAARYDLIVARRNISMAQVIRLVTEAPDSYHVHQLLGEVYVSREEDDKALTEYLAVEAARPDLPGVHFWLGHLYWKHGDADHAITELTRELTLSPGHPEANAELGTVLVAQERATEAIPHLESAIRSKPDLWPAYAQLGRAYAIEKNYARAEKELRLGLAHDHDAATHFQLALVLRAEGKSSEAAEAFAQVRAIKTEKMAALSSEDIAVQSAQSEGARQ